MRPGICAAFCLILLAGCGQDLTVEQQIIKTLHTMEEAAENGQHFEFIGFVAESFRGQNGAMDRREFHRFMLFQINKNRRLSAQFLPIYVQETGERQASARFRILITGGGGLLPERGQMFEVETHWQLEDGDWSLTRADWVPAYLDEVI